MIKKTKTLSMAEVLEYIKKDKEEETDLKGFLKKFTELNPKEAKELKEKIVSLNLLQIDEKKLTKILDFLPKSTEDLNKIFIDTGLDEDENKKILEIVKEHI